MNKDGALTFVAPLEIDAAWGSTKLTFKRDREAKWDIYLDASPGDTTLLRISQLAAGVPHMVFVPHPHNILSIMDSVSMTSDFEDQDIFDIGASMIVRSLA
jgi:hypothetical protein